MKSCQFIPNSAKVAKAQRNKMTDRGQSNNILIHSLKENTKKKNTQQNTNNWINFWKSWASENRYEKRIEEYRPETLTKILEA